jgi:hypothetical protein
MASTFGRPKVANGPNPTPPANGSLDRNPGPKRIREPKRGKEKREKKKGNGLVLLGPPSLREEGSKRIREKRKRAKEKRKGPKRREKGQREENKGKEKREWAGFAGFAGFAGALPPSL